MADLGPRYPQSDLARVTTHPYLWLTINRWLHSFPLDCGLVVLIWVVRSSSLVKFYSGASLFGLGLSVWLCCSRLFVLSIRHPTHTGYASVLTRFSMKAAMICWRARLSEVVFRPMGVLITSEPLGWTSFCWA